jgi:hypothetical protein
LSDLPCVGTEDQLFKEKKNDNTKYEFQCNWVTKEAIKDRF